MLAEGQNLRIRVTLQPASAQLTIRSNVSDDRVLIDGAGVGSSGPKPLEVEPGPIRVRVEKEGYESWEGVIEVEPGEVLRIRPRLTRVQVVRKPRPRRAPQAVSAPSQEATEPRRDRETARWHEEAKQWLLARYDSDRSGLIDTVEELHEIPCDRWLGLEQSHNRSGLGLSLTRFYGFDGQGWKENALGIGNGIRDLAHRRMLECGLR